MLSQHMYSLDDDKNYIDSITKLIKNTKSDSIKCINYFNLSLLHRRNKNHDLSNLYLQKGNALATKYPTLKDISISYNATLLLIKGNYNEYGKQLLLANEKLKKYKNDFIFSHRASILKSLAVINQIKQNEKESMRILINEAVPLAKKSNDYEILSNLYKTIGIIFMNHNDRKKAEKYFKYAIKYIEAAKKNSSTLQESKVDAYIISSENSSELGNYLEAKKSLENAYVILEKFPKSNLNSIYYYSKGLYYFKLNEHEKSIINYNLGIENSILNNDLTSLHRLKFAKYKSLKQLKKYTEARDLLIDLVENNKLFVVDNKINFKEIIDVCQIIGDDKNGYKYSLKYINLTDSLYETNSKKEIIELEAKYNTSEKENKINQLEAQKQKALLISEKNKFNYQLFSLLSIVLILIIIFLWKNATNQKKLAIEKEKNYFQSITTLKNQKEIEIMQAMISGEEEERKRVARDLHDGVGSRLSALKMKLVNNPKMVDDSVDNASLINLLNLSISELRQVAYNLIPETLLKLGLENALYDLCHSLNTKEVSIHFHANEIKKNISESNQITIFRIVQELINNALKHSNCSEIIIACSQNENLFLITVEDNGSGFAESEIANFKGFGLKNIRNRIDLLNGKLEIESSLNKGSCFNIELYI